MLKGSRNAKVAKADLDVLNLISSYFKLVDEVNKTTMNKVLFYVFIDENLHTMSEIGDLTGNSICTVRRYIRKFNSFIECGKTINC